MLTGVMLAVARAAGETAPLLFTAAVQQLLDEPTAPNFLPKSKGDLMKPTASLAVMIYNFSGSPFENQIALAWTAALVLVGDRSWYFNVVGQAVADVPPTVMENRHVITPVAYDGTQRHA